MQTKQSTSFQVRLGPFLSDADGKTPMTALSLDNTNIYLSKNNGPAVLCNDNNTAIHDGDGYYVKDFDVTDSDTIGDLKITVDYPTLAVLPVEEYITVQPAWLYDPMHTTTPTVTLDRFKTSKGFQMHQSDVNGTAWEVCGGKNAIVWQPYSTDNYVDTLDWKGMFGDSDAPANNGLLVFSRADKVGGVSGQAVWHRALSNGPATRYDGITDHPGLECIGGSNGRGMIISGGAGALYLSTNGAGAVIQLIGGTGAAISMSSNGGSVTICGSATTSVSLTGDIVLGSGTAAGTRSIIGNVRGTNHISRQTITAVGTNTISATGTALSSTSPGISPFADDYVDCFIALLSSIEKPLPQKPYRVVSYTFVPDDPAFPNGALNTGTGTWTVERDFPIADYIGFAPEVGRKFDIVLAGPGAEPTDSGAGTGARTVTITVNDGVNPIEGAKVRVTKGVTSYILVTGISGEVVFNLDDGTWTVAISLANYSFSGTSLVVNGDEVQTYSMIPAGSIVPSDPGMTTLFSVVYDLNGNPLAGQTVSATVVRAGFDAQCKGFIASGDPRVVTSDANGVVQWPNSFKGVVYRFKSGEGNETYEIIIPTTAGDTYELPPIRTNPTE